MILFVNQVGGNGAQIPTHVSERFCSSVVLVVQADQPPLGQLLNLAPQHVPAEALGDLGRGVEHLAGAVAHEPDDLERLHAALLALAALGRQQLQQGLVDVELAARERLLLAARRARDRGEVVEQREVQRVADELLFEALRLGEAGGGRFVGGVLVHGVRAVAAAAAARGLGGIDGDLEFEVGKEGAGEVGVFIAAFEDDAVEAVVGNGDRPVGLLFAARGKTSQQLGI